MSSELSDYRMSEEKPLKQRICVFCALFSTVPVFAEDFGKFELLPNINNKNSMNKDGEEMDEAE